jgi:hypothetical protein
MFPVQLDCRSGVANCQFIAAFFAVLITAVYIGSQILGIKPNRRRVIADRLICLTDNAVIMAAVIIGGGLLELN